jgi:DNA-binding transcriptional regulator YiaG
MAKALSKTARDALAAMNWGRVDAMTDEDIARQIASNPDAAPDMAPKVDVRAIRRAAGMTQAEFAALTHSAFEPCRNGSAAPRNRAVRREPCCAPSKPILTDCEKLLPAHRIRQQLRTEGWATHGSGSAG